LKYLVELVQSRAKCSKMRANATSKPKYLIQSRAKRSRLRANAAVRMRHLSIGSLKKKSFSRDFLLTLLIVINIVTSHQATSLHFTTIYCPIRGNNRTV
jgi:hypothetical protein